MEWQYVTGTYLKRQGTERKVVIKRIMDGYFNFKKIIFHTLTIG